MASFLRIPKDPTFCKDLTLRISQNLQNLQKLILAKINPLKVISYCSFSSLILPSVAIMSFYILSRRFFLKCKWLSDTRVASRTKNEYGFDMYFLYRFIKSWKSISVELLNAICWSSCMDGQEFHYVFLMNFDYVLLCFLL